MNTHVLWQSRHWLVLSVAAAVAYAGTLWRYAERLWAQSHFQFFPVFLIAVVWLTVSRLRNAKLPGRTTWRIGPITFGLAVAAMAGSAWVSSPWLSALSLLFLGDSLLSSLPLARSSWRLLALLIMLPMGLDEQAVHSLQRISSTHASTLLDRLHIPHLMRGNVLELASQRLFVEEACSGMSSVYLLMAATALSVVWERTRMVRAIPLLLSVLWWAIVGNVVRIVVIAAAIHINGSDLTTGWQHETLGVVVLLLSLSGIYSTNCLLRFLLAEISNFAQTRDNGSRVLTPVRLWNLCTETNRRPPAVPMFSLKQPRQRLFNTLTLLLLASGGWYWTCVARAAMIANEHPQQSWTTKIDPAIARFSVRRASERLNQSALGAIADLTVNVFHSDTQTAVDERALSGTYSDVWDVSMPFGDGRVAVNGPFEGWHDLRKSYESQGWKLEQTTVHAIPRQIPGRDLVTVRMIDADGHRANLHFCLTSTLGSLLHATIDDEGASVVTRFQDRLTNTMTPAHGGRWWQLQVLIRHDRQPLESEVQAERRIFADIFASILQHWNNNQKVAVP